MPQPICLTLSLSVKSLSLRVSAESHQVLAQLLDTLLVIGSQLPESPTLRQRLIEVACKVSSHQYVLALHRETL